MEGPPGQGPRPAAGTIMKVQQQGGMEGDPSGNGGPPNGKNVSQNIISNPHHHLFQQDQNPMMNDVILKHLFEQLSSTPGELNKSRLVCRQWYKVGLPVWLKNGATIVIDCEADATDWDSDSDGDGDDDFHKFLEQVHLNPSTTTTAEEDEDVDAVGGTGIKQYRKFHLQSNYTEYRPQDFEVFWTECGRHLTHLTLDHFMELPDSATFRNILLCKHTPNLEYLVVDIYSIGMEDESLEPRPRLHPYVITEPENKKLHTLKVDVQNLQSQPFPVEWKSLLSHFTNLKHFGVGRYMAKRAACMKGLLMAIKEIRNEDKTRLELKSFLWSFNQCFGCDFDGLAPQAPTPIPPLLREVQLSLETFSFSFRENATKEEIRQLLSTYSPTLKKLKFYREKAMDPFPFPEMSQLRSLEISGFPVKDLAFLKWFPSLHSLRICDDYYRPDENEAKTLISSASAGVEPAAAPGMTAGGFPLLSEFRCTYNVPWTANDFTKLLELMPNLCHLGMRLSNTNFPLVCQYFPQLEHLRVYGDELGDDGILGVGEANEEGEEVVYTQPNIARLCKLKSFHLDCGDILSANFSQKSVVHGFLSLPLLGKLVFIVSKIDPEIKKVVSERVPFAEVKELPADYCPLCGPKPFC